MRFFHWPGLRGHSACKVVVCAALLFASAVLFADVNAQVDEPSAPRPLPARSEGTPGLRVAFRANNVSPEAIDDTVLPNLALFVPAGQTPTPFLPPGKFQALWHGLVSAELKGDYQFQAELRGRFRLEINGKQLLDVSAPENRTELSAPIRLNKGTNVLQAWFETPPTGDAFVRMRWIPKGGWPSPIPFSALSHLADEAGPRRAEEGHEGRQLFLDFRCARCHSPQPGTPLLPELAPDAPSFEGIGSRRTFAWMTQWILDPAAQRIGARMPRLFHTNAHAQADAAAAYLSTLRESAPSTGIASPAAQGESAGAALVEAGKRLAENLHCVACHNLPGTADSDPERVSLRAVARKFAPGRLEAFLKAPEASEPAIRMPNFKLSDEEASQLSAFLLAVADRPEPLPQPPAADLVKAGEKVIQTSGCLACHALKLENQFAAKALSQLPAGRWDKGCLASSREPGSAAPGFSLSSKERAALQAFARTDRASVLREAPIEFALRQLAGLRCAECHGKFEGFPSLDLLHGKLRPEWMKSFIAGELSYRPRPWLPARMPAFPWFAERLVTGMAMLNGYPPRTPEEGAIDSAAAQIGQKLVGADGGFICVSCHSVGAVGATQVFENAGINLAYASSRLLKDYYLRWIRNPLAIDPVSKMPVFFDEELHSPLPDYDGSGARQIEAIWEYLRLGKNMPPPATAAKETP